MESPFEPGKYYHLYNHAIGIENLFRQEENYRYFLMRYANFIPPIADTFAYCLMPNHFHVLIRVREAQDLMQHYSLLVKEKRQQPKVIDADGLLNIHEFVILQFKHFLNSYAQAYNKRFRRKGGLFLHFLRRKEVETFDYFTRLIHYIHWNPVHHGFCPDPGQWPYSSYRSMISDAPTQLARDEVLNWYGGKAPFVSMHQKKPEGKLILDF